MASAVVVGGSSGIGLVIAQRLAARGDDVVVTSPDAGRAQAAAAEVGSTAQVIELDLGAPESIEAALSGIEAVDHLVITAIEQASTR